MISVFIVEALMLNVKVMWLCYEGFIILHIHESWLLDDLTFGALEHVGG